MGTFTVYCDGGCFGNGLREFASAYGSFIVLNEDDQTVYHEKRDYPLIYTNNEAELVAAIRALAFMANFPNSRDYNWKLYSDSTIIVRYFTKGRSNKTGEYRALIGLSRVYLHEIDNLQIEYVPREVIVSRLGH